MMFPASLQMPSKIACSATSVGGAPSGATQLSPNSRYKNVDLEPNQVFGPTGQPMQKMERLPRSSFVELCGEIFLASATKCSDDNSSSDASSSQQHEEQIEFDFETTTNKNNATGEDGSKPSEYDILVGRHKNAFNHVGNRRFRLVISSFLPKYFDSPSRTHRARLVLEIIQSIQCTGGRFVKEVKGVLVELNDKEKRNKVGHALRDAARAHKNSKVLSTSSCGPSSPSASSAARNFIKKQQQYQKQLAKMSAANPKTFSMVTSLNKVPCVKTGGDITNSPFNDDDIGVDFPIDLDLLLSMP